MKTRGMNSTTTATHGVLPATLLTLLLTSLAGSLLAEGTPAAGKEKAKVCEACHGLDGKSIAPNYPNLAGQHESYLVKALADYRAGRRTNPIMAPMAMNLSDQDIEDLAAWYASQEGLKDLSIK
jgi:cytochrome c553